MLRAFRRLFVPPPPTAATDVYIALVGHARNPFFFESLGVPDTLDGRFELIVLHLFLMQHRLREADPGFAQFLSEVFFADMDRSLRELGIADTGVRHRIKAMGKAYHGRLQAYAAGLNDRPLLLSALARNLYGTVKEGDVGILNRMADYVMRTHACLTTTETHSINSGMFHWPVLAV